MFQKKPTAVAESYQASGRFAPMFLPMLALAACVAVGMAYVLQLAGSRNLYYYFVAPLLVGSPALGAIALTVYLGKCRNTLLGGMAGLVVALVFYVGYWQISYQQTVGRMGPIGQAILKSRTGVGGLPGYFLFRCRTSRPSSSHGPDRTEREPTTVDAVFNYAFFGGELLMLSAIGWVIGRAMAGRVFYEDEERWGNSFSFRLAPKDEPAALAAITAQDWAGLAGLPKVAHEFGEQQNAKAMRVKAEFLKGAAEAPVYLTVWPSGQSSVSGMITLVDKLSSSQWRQRTVAGESAAKFAQAFAKETQAPASRETARVSRIGGAAAVTAASDDPHALRDALIGQRSDAPGAVRIEPVDVGAVTRVRRFAWAFNIALVVALVLGLGGAIASLAAGTGDNDKDQTMTPLQVALATVFVVGMLGGLMTLTLFWRIRYALLRRELARRAGSLIGSMRRPQAFRVCFAKEFHLKEKGLDDIALVSVDAQRRLLIEGIRYRYIVPAAAVRQVVPVQSDATLAIQVDFEAMGQQVQLILARENLKGHWQSHIPLLSAAGDAEKVASALREHMELGAACEA